MVSFKNEVAKLMDGEFFSSYLSLSLQMNMVLAVLSRRNLEFSITALKGLFWGNQDPVMM